MKILTFRIFAIVAMAVIGLGFISLSNDQKGHAQVEAIDNVYVFVNSKPTMLYDTVFKFYFTAVTHNQTRPLKNYYKNVVKSAYKKDEGKAFEGILFSSDDGYHYAINFK